MKNPLFSPTRALVESLQLLTDIELLIRINAPMTDGSPIHKAVIEFIKKWKVAE